MSRFQRRFLTCPKKSGTKSPANFYKAISKAPSPTVRETAARESAEHEAAACEAAAREAAARETKAHETEACEAAARDAMGRYVWRPSRTATFTW